MAVAIPLYMDGVPYNAEAERRGLSGLMAQSAAGTPRSGILGPAPNVTVSGSTVKVSPFNAVISSSKGAYLVAVDSVTDAVGAVGVADSTNPRMDRLVLEVLDPNNGITGGTRIGRLRLIPGEARAIPGLPPLPALALHIAQVLVPKSTNGAAVTPVVTEDPKFTAAAGAPVPVRNTEDRASLSAREGLAVQRLDMGGRVQTYTGGRWRSDPQITVEGTSSEAPTTKYGTVSAASDANGAAAYIFSEPFPNRILGATLTQVYTSSLGLVDLRYDEGLSNQNRVAFFCYDAAGNLLRNLNGIRFTFTAWGD